MAFIQGFPRFKALLADGSPAVGYKLYSYLAGTSTPESTYTDQTEAAANPNPTILDGNGEAAIWLKPTTAYKLVLKTDADVEIGSVDGLNTREGAYFTTLNVNGLATMAAITASGQITSTVADGTAPLVITSTTKVTNLNADKVDGGDWAAPGAALGSGTPQPAIVTTLQVNSTETVDGNVTHKGNRTSQTANGGQWVQGQISEEITLSTSGATTDSVADLLPANSIIEAVVARLTQAITVAANWKMGDSAQAARFTAANSTLALGTTDVGLLQHNPANASNDLGPVQTAAAKLRITCNATPGAGKARVTVFYRQFVGPSS